MNTAFRILEAAQRVAERNQWRPVANRLSHIQSAPHYSEPGYSTTHDVILFGNWNSPVRTDYDGQSRRFVCRNSEDEKQSRFFAGVCKALENVAELEWDDEWTTCCDCYGAIRTSGDCYGWQRSFVELDGEILCRECAAKEGERVVESFVGDCRRCLTADLNISPGDHGFTQLPQEFENGLYGGQDADPEKIGAALEKRGVDRFVFVLDAVGQFDARFSVWVDSAQMGLLSGELPHDETKCDLDPAEGLKRALQSAPMPSGEGITYVKCDPSTGKSTARKVSPEEFRDGIKS